MKKGHIQIKVDSTNTPMVECHLNNGTVWMDRNELCELFGCHLKDIDKFLESVFKKEMFRIEETCRYHIIAGGKRVSYDITEVNLVVIIALSFLMETPQAKTLRTWFISQLLKNGVFSFPFNCTMQNFSLN